MCIDPISIASTAISAGSTIIGAGQKLVAQREQQTAGYKADLANYNSQQLAYQQQLAEYDSRLLLYDAELINQEASFLSGLSAFESYDAKARLLEEQSRLDVAAANREIAAGEFDVERMERDIARLTGHQRASYLASGVDIEGSPADVIFETEQEGQREIDTIRFNAKTRAQSFLDRSKLSTIEAGEARRAGNAVLDQSVLLAGTPIVKPIAPATFTGAAPERPRSSGGLANTLSTLTTLGPTIKDAGTKLKSIYNRGLS